MEIVEIQVYDFDELAESVQRDIVNKWRVGDDFPFFHDWESSIYAFFNAFDCIRLNYFSWAGCHNYNRVRFDIGEDLQDISGIRLHKYLLNNYDDLLEKWDTCELTGFTGDISCLEPIAKFMQKPDQNTTFEELINDCFHSWCNGVQSDYDYWLSEDSIIEDITANMHQFTEEGDVYHA
jgi:hypothetical protein